MDSCRRRTITVDFDSPEEAWASGIPIVREESRGMKAQTHAVATGVSIKEDSNGTGQ